MQFDETDFIEAPQGKTTLKFLDDKQQARFELGVSMMVYRWDALDIAVENKWGGPDSADKRDWITGVICGAFRSEKVIDVAFIEESLLYAMVDEFDTNVEDDSALPIAAGIIELYKQIDAFDFSGVEQLYLAYQEKQNNKASQRVIKIQEDPLNPDSSSSEDEDSDEGDYEMEEDIMEEQFNLDQEPIVDDDGFELVQKKCNRRN